MAWRTIRCLSLAEGRNGSIWIGTDGGFSRWRNGEVESFLPKNGLSQSTVASLYEDREGSLWVGTKRGLNQFLDRRTLPFTTSEGLPSDDTGPVFQDPRGVIWVGTLGAGLARFDGRRSSVLTKQDGLSSNSILALAGDAKGTFWVGNRLPDWIKFATGKSQRYSRARFGVCIGTAKALCGLEHRRAPLFYVPAASCG